MMGSWKTTTVAILTVLTVVFGAVINVLDTDPATVNDWNKIIMAIVGALQGLGFYLTKDSSAKD